MTNNLDKSPRSPVLRPQASTDTDHLDRIADAVVSIDRDWRVSYANQTARNYISAIADVDDHGGLIGAGVWDLFPEALDTLTGTTLNEVMDGEGPISYEDYLPEPLDIHIRATAYPSDDGLSIYYRDISHEYDQEQRLEKSTAELTARVEQQHAVAELGQIATGVTTTEQLDDLFHEACVVVSDVLDNEYCKVLDLDPEAQELLLRQGVGWRDGIVGKATVESNTNSQAGFTLLQEEPVIVSNLEEETRFSGPDLLTSHDVVSGVSVIIGPWENPWGILGTHDTRERTFNEYDADFVQQIANILANTIDNVQREIRLAYKRAKLSALNACYSTVRNISHSILEESSRDAVEELVCEHLVSDHLDTTLAWIGSVDYGDKYLTPNHAAGEKADYLSDIEIPIGPDGTAGKGPAVTAIRTHKSQVISDLETDERVGPWRDAMLHHGFRSAIAIPIVHDNIVYGILAIYSPTPGTFDGEVSMIFNHLGQIIGHAINSIEQKQALRGDSSVVELQYRNTHVVDPLKELQSDDPLVVEVERMIDNDGSPQAFCRVTGPPLDTFLECFADFPAVEDVTFVRQPHDDIDPADHCKDTLVMVTLSPDSITAAVEGHGGRVKSLRIDDNELRLGVEASPTVDIAALTHHVVEGYPGTELLSKRTVQREWTTVEDLERIVNTGLTDRQIDVLQSAYLAGYFEKPRGHSGEEVAAMLGISGATFSQHLRSAQSHLLSAIF